MVILWIYAGTYSLPKGYINRVNKGKNMKFVHTGLFYHFTVCLGLHFRNSVSKQLTQGEFLRFDSRNIHGRQLGIKLFLLDINCYNSLKNAATNLKLHF